MSFKSFKRPTLVSLGLAASAAFTACDNPTYIKLTNTDAQNTAKATVEEDNRQAQAFYAGSQKKIFAVTYMDHANDTRGGTQVVPSVCFTDSSAVAEAAEKGNIRGCLKTFTINSRQGNTESFLDQPYTTLTQKLGQALQVYKGTYKGDTPVTRFPHVAETSLRIEKSEGMNALMFLPEYDLACNVELRNYRVSISESGALNTGDEGRPRKQERSGDYLYVDKTVVSISNCEDVPTGQNFAFQARMKYLKAEMK